MSEANESGEFDCGSSPSLSAELANEFVLPRDAPIIFRVKATWAHKGRTGAIDSIVVATDAIEALQLAWQPEDPHHLRDVSIEWLTPEQCVTIGERP